MSIYPFKDYPFKDIPDDDIYRKMMYGSWEITPKRDAKYIFIKDFKPIDLLTEKKGPTQQEKNIFAQKMVLKGLDLYIPIKMTQEFHDYFTQHPCFVDYLIRNGYIREAKAFEPFSITFRFETEDQFMALWHRLNVNDQKSLCDYFKERSDIPAKLGEHNLVSKFWHQLEEARESKCGK